MVASVSSGPRRDTNTFASRNAALMGSFVHPHRCCVKSPPVVWRHVSRAQASQQVSRQVLVAYFSRSATQVPARRCCRLSQASLP